MKNIRHRKILSLINERPVETQEELARLLSEAGFKVTQATVSRDIKELRLVKLQDGESSKYVAVNKETRDMSIQKYKSILRDTVISVACAMNLVVVRCHIGMAGAACVALDFVMSFEAVGTLAGDDTIFIALADAGAAERYAAELKNYL